MDSPQYQGHLTMHFFIFFILWFETSSCLNQQYKNGSNLTRLLELYLQLLLSQDPKMVAATELNVQSYSCPKMASIGI